jgi:hypothetical protein
MASVSVTHRGTGLTRSVQTDNLGNYRFSSLPIGVYDVVVARDGFSTLHSTGAEVAVGATTQLDLQLKVAQVSQDVTVQATAAVLNTESAGRRRADELQSGDCAPFNGRNFHLVHWSRAYEQYGSGQAVVHHERRPPAQGINLLVDGTDATGIETAEWAGFRPVPGQSVFTLGLDSISNSTCTPTALRAVRQIDRRRY